MATATDDRQQADDGSFQSGGQRWLQGRHDLRGTDLYVPFRRVSQDQDMAAPKRCCWLQLTHADGQLLTYNTGDVRQAGCLIASHGPAHAALCAQSAKAMATIDPGFQV